MARTLAGIETVSRRLLAGPLLLHRGVHIIPIAECRAWVWGDSVIGSTTPVAIVTVVAGRVSSLPLGEDDEATEDWLERVPGLARLIAEARGVRD